MFSYNFERPLKEQGHFPRVYCRQLRIHHEMTLSKMDFGVLV